jgi:hypothetical protein
VIGLALRWTWRIGPEVGWLGQSVLAWHWYLALGLLAPLAFHAWQRWPYPRRRNTLSLKDAAHDVQTR